MMEKLVLFGLNTLYPKLQWLDKLTILDIANRT